MATVITMFATVAIVTSPVFPGIVPRLLYCSLVIGILRAGTIYSTLINVVTGCLLPSVAHPNVEGWRKRRHAPDKPALSYLEMGLPTLQTLQSVSAPLVRSSLNCTLRCVMWGNAVIPVQWEAQGATRLISNGLDKRPKSWEKLFAGHIINHSGPGSSVGISDWLRAGRSGDRIPVGARFYAPVQTGPGAHPVPCTMGIGSFPGVKSGRGVTLTHHPILVPWSWKDRAILLLPLWAVRPVQSLSACTSFTLQIVSIFYLVPFMITPCRQ